jgi:hypothetical protein
MPTDRLPTWLLPEVRLASRPALLSLILLLLFGLGAVLACWSTKAPEESADFDLLTDHSSPKLDITSAEAPNRPSAPALPSEADNTGWIAKAPPVPVPEDQPTLLEIPVPDPADLTSAYKIPDLPEAPKPEAPKLEAPEPSAAPIIDDAGNLIISSLRGDTPMIRTWKMLGYPAILAAALSTAPQLASAGEKEGQGTDSKPDAVLRELKESLKNIDRKLEQNTLNCNVIVDDVRKLKEQVAQLQKDLDSLRGRMSVSNYQPTTAPTTATSSGRIRLVNTWPQKVAVFLNDKVFYVEPGQTKEVADMPAGAFTYQVIEQRLDNFIQPITEKLPRTLAANETFTIHVHPH